MISQATLEKTGNTRARSTNTLSLCGCTFTKSQERVRVNE